MSAKSSGSAEDVILVTEKYLTWQQNWSRVFKTPLYPLLDRWVVPGIQYDQSAVSSNPSNYIIFPTVYMEFFMSHTNTRHFILKVQEDCA